MDNDSILIRYNCLSSEINALYHELALKLGMSDSVLSILYVICERGDKCLQSDIFHESGISRQTINSAIRKLEAEEIVRLEPGVGRNTIVYLTEKGKTYCAERITPVFEIENSIFASWTECQRSEYLNLTKNYLSRLRDAIKHL